MTSLVSKNKQIARDITKQLIRLRAADGQSGIRCLVNDMGVIVASDDTTRVEIISTQVAEEWLSILIDALPHSANYAWKAFDEATEKYGYGGSHTMNPTRR